MSYTEWKRVDGRQEARASGKPWRRIEEFEANSPAGSTPVKEFHEIGIEKCSHNDGLYCGGTREEHPRICSCFGAGTVPIETRSGRTYQGHEFI